MLNTNYTIVEEGFVNEYQAKVTVYSHNITKAKIVHIDNNDTNCLFAVVFSTPSWGSKGVAHILEHSVLCGSIKYPHKELFGELAKISQSTFLNAMTYPDKTLYPVASNNPQDFFNLQSAYLDSVFAPLVMQEGGDKIFAQEGHHLEFDDKGQLIRKGVVYNEMKGAYSTYDSWLVDTYNAALYPDTCYSQSSGGLPSAIGSLTYQEFKDFYTKFYHPSNSTIFLTGSQITQKNFDLVDEYLSQYDYLEVESIVDTLTEQKRTVANCAISYQSQFQAPRTICVDYPDSKSALIWATSNGNSNDLYQVYWHKIVRRLLIGNSTSPLRQAIETSGLGSNFYYGDPDDDALAQIYNPIGLIGVETENLDKVANLIDQTLLEIVKKDFDQETIESSINSLCLNLLENSLYPDSPKNLGLVSNILNSTLYGGQVLDALNYTAIIDRIKSEILANPRAMQDFIQKYWIDNNHKVIIKLTGDPEFLEKIKQEEVNQLANYQKSLSSAQIQDIKDNAQELKDWQTTEVTQEALDSIPRLNIKDIPKEQSKSTSNFEIIDNYEVLTSQLESNGINYIGLAIDTSNLDEKQLTFLPIYLKCLTEIDSINYTSSQIKKYIDRYTGGLTKQIINSTLNDQSEVIYKYYIQGTALAKNSTQLATILQEIIYKTKFDSTIKAKLKQLITEKKSLMKEGFLDNGNREILSYLSSKFNQVSYINHLQTGYKQIQFLEKLEQEFEERFEDVLSTLQSIQSVTNSVKPLINLGGKISDIKLVAKDITRNLESPIFTNTPKIQSATIFQVDGSQDLDIIYNTQVNYVGQVITLPSDINIGGAMLANRYLAREFLWNKVRIQGGAYGAAAVFRPTLNLFGLASYRDPNHSKTFVIYDTVGQEITQLKLDEDSLNKLKIGAIGDFDNHNYPDDQIIINLQNHLIGETNEYRQSVRDQILSATIEDINQFGKLIKEASGSKVRGAIKAKNI